MREKFYLNVYFFELKNLLFTWIGKQYSKYLKINQFNVIIILNFYHTKENIFNVMQLLIKQILLIQMK